MSFHTLAPYLTEGHGNSLVGQNVLIYLTPQFLLQTIVKLAMFTSISSGTALVCGVKSKGLCLCNDHLQGSHPLHSQHMFSSSF